MKTPVTPPDLRDTRKLALKVPEELRMLPAWLIWRFEVDPMGGKPLKVPYWTDGVIRHGQQGGPKDRAKLTTFAAARDAAARMGFEGVGFAPLPDFRYTFLDFDHCVAVDGNLHPEVLAIVDRTYAEYSPSGRGVRAVLRGNLGNHKSKATPDRYGFETFSSTGFVTFTGNILPGCEILGYENHVAEVDQRTIDLCEQRFGSSTDRSYNPDDFMAGREPKLGLSITEMEYLVNQLDPDMGREDWIRVGMAIHHETEGGDDGFEIWDEWSSDGATYPGTQGLQTQWDSFDRRAGSNRRQVTMATVKKMAKEAGSTPSVASWDEDWPSPIALPDTLPSVPTLERDMLPDEFGPWLDDIARRLSVPLDFVAVPAMVMMGSLIGRRVTIRPEELTSWSEPANLWGAIIAEPGALKSPAVQEVLAPLNILEAKAAEENGKAQLRYNAELAKSRLAKENAEKEAKGLLKNGLDPIEALMAAALEPAKPKLKRFITSDATVEKLGEICADNPNGVLYHRDELFSLLTELDKAEKATARGFMMSGWAGLGGYTFDRISRGTVHVPSVTISMLGTSQPNRIREYIATSLRNNDDGMVQRLQLMVWPDPAETWTPADRAPDGQARNAAVECCRRLSNLSASDVGAQDDGDGSLPYLRFTPEARELFTAYRSELERKVRDRTLSPHLTSHFAKYRGLVPRLALVLHLASGGTGPVSESAMQKALLWAAYLEAHARRIYGALDAEKADVARLIWKRVEAGDIMDGFTAREIRQKGWSGLTNKNQVQAALTMLVECDWLRANKLQTGGRGKVCYSINPRAG